MKRVKTSMPAIVLANDFTPQPGYSVSEEADAEAGINPAED